MKRQCPTQGCSISYKNFILATVLGGLAAWAIALTLPQAFADAPKNTGRFAHILADGTIDLKRSYGVTQENIKPGVEYADICFTGFPINGAQVTVDFQESPPGTTAQFGVSVLPGCEGFITFNTPDFKAFPFLAGVYVKFY